MLTGVTTRIKIPVAYDLTANSFNVKTVMDNVHAIIGNTKDAGGIVVALSMDMGTSNQGI